MKITNREITVAVALAAAALLGATYVVGEPLFSELTGLSASKLQAERSLVSARRLLGQADTWKEKLDGYQKQLLRYRPDQPVTADLLKKIKALADSNGVNLSKTEPDKEKGVGDLFEEAIKCDWEGTLDSMVKFLYAVQSQGAMLDIRQLTVTPAQGQPGRLKGNFVIHCAFIREGQPAEKKAASEKP